MACSKSPSDLEDDILYGVVVREVVEYIRESTSSSENVTPVFKLRNLRTLATRRLAEHYASKESIDRIHNTRLKEDILKELPGVSETRHGKDVLLTPSKDVGAQYWMLAPSAACPMKECELSITRHLCKMYQQQGDVCPPMLRKGLFTTAAIDNIYHNPSSATAMEAFHGNSISIFQHPEQEQSQEFPLFDKEIQKLEVPLDLPQSYSTSFPTKTVCSEYPRQNVCAQDITYSDSSRFFTADE